MDRARIARPLQLEAGGKPPTRVQESRESRQGGEQKDRAFKRCERVRQFCGRNHNLWHRNQHRVLNSPKAGAPIDPVSFPKEWLEQIINSRIQPRIPGILINSIPLSSAHPGRCAHVVCIPQGATAHQASDRRYYKRYNFESVAKEDYEIRQTMDRASRAAYSIALEPSEISSRNDLRFFKLHCMVENLSELVGQDVSAVVFVPRHLISQPDSYEVSIEGGLYSRIPGVWLPQSYDQRSCWTHPPLTPYRVFFG